MGEYLSFKKLITPALIQVVFWAAVVINTIDALFYSGSFFVGLLMFIVGPILIRVICEAVIVVFEINNTLTDIRDNQIIAAEPPPVVMPAESPTPPVV